VAIDTGFGSIVVDIWFASGSFGGERLEERLLLLLGVDDFRFFLGQLGTILFGSLGLRLVAFFILIGTMVHLDWSFFVAGLLFLLRFHRLVFGRLAPLTITNTNKLDILIGIFSQLHSTASTGSSGRRSIPLFLTRHIPMILRLISHKRPGFTGCQSPAWLEVVLLVVMMMVRWHLPALSGRAVSIEWMRRRRTAIIRIGAISTVTRR
jgi:hypothetical protein